MEKILLFTHGIDIDGYGCAILAKLAWHENVDIVFAENFDLDDKFRELWTSGKLSGYSKIFITDHCLSKELCVLVDDCDDLNKKIRVIDHHKSRASLQEQFKWIMVCDERKTKKECGTSLFYEYLLQCGLLNRSAALDELVELTRLQDTFLFETAKNGDKAIRLDVFSKVEGRQKYVEILTERLSHSKTLYFLPGEDKEIDDYLEKLDKIINGYISNLKIVEFEGKKAGLVEILDEHKADVTRRVRKSPLGQELDFLLMPILDRRTISLRNVRADCDVAQIAQRYGGGGHFAAASIPKENLDLTQFCENS